MSLYNDLLLTIIQYRMDDIIKALMYQLFFILLIQPVLIPFSFSCFHLFRCVVVVLHEHVSLCLPLICLIFVFLISGFV